MAVKGLPFVVKCTGIGGLGKLIFELVGEVQLVVQILSFAMIYSNLSALGIDGDGSDYMSSSQILPVAVGTVAVGMSAAYYLSHRGTRKIEPITDLNNQTVETSTSDRSRVSRAFNQDGKLIATPFEDVTTLYQGFRRGARVSNNGECLGWRPVQPDGTVGAYVWMSYNDAIRKAEHIAAGYLACGLEIGQGSFIGLYASNRPEWVITEQACYVYNMVLVPLYDTLGPDACSFIINQADIKIVICDKIKKMEPLLSKKDACPSLTHLVVMEPVSPELRAQGEAAGITILTFDELEQLGIQRLKTNPVPCQPPKPDDLSTICYTSGTTGAPKGVMLTHGNIVADCTAYLVLKRTAMQRDDCMISFLPLAHMFERLLESICFMVGAKVGFYQGDIKYLTDDIKVLAPTVMPVVPRLLNRIFDKVMSEVNKSSLKKTLFNWAMSSKQKELSNSIVSNNTIWDRLIFKRVREGMGGRVRVMVTGSAPLAEHILTFVRAAMGCIVLEGYGQTECVAACTVTIEGDHTPGHVGPPIPCCRMKLVDVPEMNYFAKDNAGEVCIQGYNVFSGYYKDPERTAEALDDDGWLHTGDIARWTAQGTLKIVDRKKHIFKLAQGEYIAPEKIENVYTRSKFVAQCFVYGESLKSALIAVVVPDPEVLPAYAAKELGLRCSMKELCENEKIKKLVFDDMISEGKQGSLCTFEQVKDVHLYHELFSVENGLLTPTFKSKRPALKDFFGEQLAQMYKMIA